MKVMPPALYQFQFVSMFLPFPVCVQSSEVLVCLVSCMINTESVLNLHTQRLRG